MFSWNFFHNMSLALHHSHHFVETYHYVKEIIDQVVLYCSNYVRVSRKLSNVLLCVFADD
jgi:hypothetical protein